MLDWPWKKRTKNKEKYLKERIYGIMKMVNNPDKFYK
jgi:hypothetical protein